MKTIATVTATCPPLLAGALEPEDADSLAQALRVLADPARLRLLSLIQAQPSGEACVCHLTEPLGLSQPTVSHHLKVLLRAGLVEREQRGSWAYFRVIPDQLHTLSHLLSEGQTDPVSGEWVSPDKAGRARQSERRRRTTSPSSSSV